VRGDAIGLWVSYLLRWLRKAGQGGATDWELLQVLRNKNWWDRITFWNNASVITSKPASCDRLKTGHFESFGDAG
jgi:hypothetical protein